MPTVRQELADFHQFATEQLGNGNSDLSLEKLLDLWRATHPIEEELQESVAAVRQAIRDMELGDTGRPAEEHLRELRVRYRLDA